MVLEKQKGQILLVVVLVIIVALTVGLSLISRSITNLRTSTEEAESQEALAAAEAGLERAIQSEVDITMTSLPNNGSTYEVDVEGIDGSEFLLNGGNLVSKDEGIDVWFREHKADGTLNWNWSAAVVPSNPTLYWGTSSACDDSDVPAAIQAIAVTYNASSSVTKTYRYAYDACSSTRGNNFTTAVTGDHTITANGVSYTFKNRTDDTLLSAFSSSNPDKVVFMRVIPIYKDSIIGIYNGNSLPLQGYRIDSMGISGEANRKIRVFKGWPQTYLPYLSYGLFVAND